MIQSEETFEAPANFQRPGSITVICTVGFAGALISIPLIFSPITQQMHSWYPAFLLVSTVLLLVCVAGLWMMKRWAAHLYIAFVALSQIALVAMETWHILAFLIPAVTVSFVLKSLPRMKETA